jgi:hypothetical protein
VVVVKCRLETSWALDAVQVFLYQEGGLGQPTRVLHIIEVGGGAVQPVYQWDDVDESGGYPPPTLILPREAVEALAAAASDFAPPSEATERHLYDAIGTRDRLLALVELQANPAQVHEMPSARGAT